MQEHLTRVLLYSHNAIGLGHAFRSLAIITGMRRSRPDVDFLVISGTSVPHIFFREGIEVIKLPALKTDISVPGQHFSPRYLKSMNTADLVEYRKKIILEGFNFFKPQAVFIEHTMGGLLGEALPLVMEKDRRRGSPEDFALVHLSRGIVAGTPRLTVPSFQDREGKCMDAAGVFDFIYVFEERGTVDVNREFYGDDPALEKQINYVGKICTANPGELMKGEEVRRRFCLDGRPVIVASLGRHGDIGAMAAHLMEAIESLGLPRSHQVIIILDPYLDGETLGSLRSSHGLKARLIPFTANLVDLISLSDLYICRAGYNTVTEVLMTGARALIIPEHHPSGEQERRAAALTGGQLAVIDAKRFLEADASPLIRELLARDKSASRAAFDRFLIGEQMVKDLEGWLSRKPHICSSQLR
ncbi:MAG: glycosyltransferase [Candidatus Eremiobacteraeota bacterium]|nr:glycosyltransferase [Candidatus Eremiobacteraeota bacterium]